MNIEKERFEAWLYNQPRDREVNLAHSSDCLLCHFIKETTGHNYPMVLFDSFTLNLGNSGPFEADTLEIWQDIPDWFQKLVHAGVETRTTYGQMQDAFRSVFPIEKEKELVA